MLKTLQDKYKTISMPVKASFWFMFCSILQKGISLISSSFFTRILTTEQFGLFTTYNSWLSIVSIFATLNLFCGVLNNSLNNCSIQKEKDMILSNYLFIQFLCSLFVFSILFIVTWVIDDFLGLNKYLILLMAVNIFFTSGFSLYSARARFEFNYKPVVLLSILFSVVNVGFNFLLIYLFKYKEYALILGGSLASLTIFLPVVIIIFVKGKSIFNFKIWKYGILFNLPLIPHYLAMVVLASVDRIMIERMLGLTDAAFYGVAYTIGSLLIIVINAIESSLTPWTYQEVKAQSYDNIKKKTTLILMFIFCVCSFTMLISPEILWIYGGDTYLISKWSIPPIIASVYFLMVYPMYCTMEFYCEKKYFTMVSSVLAAVFNILLNWIFIPLIGYIAAAFTTLLCYIFLCIFHYVAYRIILKKRGMPLIYNSKWALILGGMQLCMVAISYLLYLNDIVRYVFIGIFILFSLIFFKKIFNLIKIILSKNSLSENSQDLKQDENKLNK